MEKSGKFELLPKKEVIQIKKEYAKLNKVLCGIREMEKLPQALIIVDPKKEINAIREARKLNIPVFGICDTNADPDDVDFVIPGNDDAVRSIKVMLGVLNNAICEVNNLEIVDYVSEDDKKNKEPKMEDVMKDDKYLNGKKEDVVVETEVKKAPKKEVKKVEKTETTEDLSSKTLSELKAIAKGKGLKGYSTMNKYELLDALK